jgi:hypothetical protein
MCHKQESKRANRYEKVDVMSRSSHPGFHSVVYQTENVPHDAIATPISNIEPSNLLHFFSMAIFALIGPMTQMRKEKREPRMPIIELNSGMAIETATVSRAIRIRWMTAPNRLKVVWHRTWSSEPW